ncbi:unnamed protein product [Closterium sp. NIES-65]|nr:unnamed protein product [Closterium sp. NIES-65]
MQLTAVLHFTDATIRAHDAALVHRHLVGAQPTLAGAVEALLGLAQRVHASDADVLAALVDALADVRLCCGCAANRQAAARSGRGGTCAWSRRRRSTASSSPRYARTLPSRPHSACPQAFASTVAAHPSPLVRAESIAVLQAFASLHAPSTRSHLPLLHAAARESAHRGVQMVAVDVEAVKEDVQRIGRQVEGEDEGEAEGVVGVVGMVRGGRAVRGAVQAAAGGRVAASRLLLPVLLHLWLHKAAAAVRQPAVRASQLLLSVMLAHGAHGLVEVPLRASQQDDVKCLGIVAH